MGGLKTEAEAAHADAAPYFKCAQQIEDEQRCGNQDVIWCAWFGACQWFACFTSARRTTPMKRWTWSVFCQNLTSINAQGMRWCSLWDRHAHGR